MEPFAPLVQSLQKAQRIDTTDVTVAFKRNLFQLNDIVECIKEQLSILDATAYDESFLTFGFISGQTTKNERERAIFDLHHLRDVLREIEWKLPLLNAQRGTVHEERARRTFCDLVIKIQNQYRQFSRYVRKGSAQDSLTLLTRGERFARKFFFPDWTGWELEKDY